MKSHSPLEIPSAWRGEQLFERSDWLVEIDDRQRAELNAAVDDVRSLPRESIDSSNFRLPTLGPRLAQIQTTLEQGGGATMIRGFSTDTYSQEEAELAFWGLCTHIGTAVSQSAGGERLFHVRDAGFGDNDPKSRGPNTRKKLSFHTDRCDVIAFLCRRQAKSGGENQIVSSVTLFNEMLRRRPDLLEVLMRPYYYRRHNVDTGNSRPYCQQPVFCIYEGHFAANLLRVLIERAYAMPELPDMTDEQREALDYLEALADESSLHVTFCQQPGDILFLNNWVTFHRRTEFVDFDQPDRKRHLFRIWLSVPNSRPLHPWFEANYGATAAGAIRGGMMSL